MSLLVYYCRLEAYRDDVDEDGRRFETDAYSNFGVDFVLAHSQVKVRDHVSGCHSVLLASSTGSILPLLVTWRPPIQDPATNGLHLYRNLRYLPCDSHEDCWTAASYSIYY
jgi:hypothetical protein